MRSFLVRRLNVMRHTVYMGIFLKGRKHLLFLPCWAMYYCSYRLVTLLIRSREYRTFILVGHDLSMPQHTQLLIGCLRFDVMQ